MPDPNPERCVSVWHVCNKGEECVHPQVMYFGGGSSRRNHSETRSEEHPIRMVPGNFYECQWFNSGNHDRSPCSKVGVEYHPVFDHFTCEYCREREEAQAEAARLAQEALQSRAAISETVASSASNSRVSTPANMYDNPLSSQIRRSQSSETLPPASTPRIQQTDVPRRNAHGRVSVPPTGLRPTIPAITLSIPDSWPTTSSSSTPVSASAQGYGASLQEAMLGLEINPHRPAGSDDGASDDDVGLGIDINRSERDTGVLTHDNVGLGIDMGPQSQAASDTAQPTCSACQSCQPTGSPQPPPPFGELAYYTQPIAYPASASQSQYASSAASPEKESQRSPVKAIWKKFKRG